MCKCDKCFKKHANNQHCEICKRLMCNENPCKGQCGCKVCEVAWSDFSSSE